MDERLVLAVLRRRAERFEMALGIALRGEDRMVEEVQRVALAVHFHRHRIDEERHVVVHDLDHGVRAGPAVLLGARVVDAELRLPGRERAREGEVRHGGAVQVLGRAIREVLGIDVVVVVRDERARFLRGRGAARRWSARRSTCSRRACFCSWVGKCMGIWGWGKADYCPPIRDRGILAP